MKVRGGPLSRLLDLHTFNYEKDTYPNHTRITKQDAEKNCSGIWEWVNAAVSADKSGDRVPHEVTECFFVLYGERNSPSVVAHTWRGRDQANTQTSAYEVPETLDPTTVLESWLQHEPPIAGIDLTPSAHNQVVTFYLLFKSELEIKKLSDFLNAPTFIASGGLLITPRGKPRTVRDILSQASGSNYYQRLCVVFGCSDEHSAKHLKPLAKQIVCGLITTWGGALERANERARATEMEAQAWSHEVGNFIRYLDWEVKTSNRHLYDLTMDFLEMATRATITTTKLPDVISLWPKLKSDRLLTKAVDLAVRFAVLRHYRGTHETLKTLEGLERKVEVFKLRFAKLETVESGLKLAGGGTNSELNRKLASFAQFIIFSMYSAARHSNDQASIHVRLAKDRFTVTNPLPTPIAGETPKSEVRAILHQAFQVLWDASRTDFTCEHDHANRVWIVDCPLPADLWKTT